MNAPFDISQCAECGKCSNREPWLFEELNDNKDCSCLDPDCWNKKIEAYIKAKVKILQKEPETDAGGNKIALVCNEYLYNEKPPYAGALDKHDYEMLELDPKVPEINAFIVSGEKAGHYCRIRVNKKPGTEPAAPATPEDKKRREEGRRIKKSIIRLCEKVNNSKFKRPDDDTLMALSSRLFIHGATVNKLSDKKTPEDIRNEIWEAVVGNIAGQLHCHAHSPLNDIDAAYGRVACDILGLSWKEFETEE